MNNILVLHKDIYNEDNVNAAIERYSELAEINYEIFENSFKLTFLNTRYGCDETIKEFENYLIHLSTSGKVKYDNY